MLYFPQIKQGEDDIRDFHLCTLSHLPTPIFPFVGLIHPCAPNKYFFCAFYIFIFIFNLSFNNLTCQNMISTKTPLSPIFVILYCMGLAFFFALGIISLHGIYIIYIMVHTYSIYMVATNEKCRCYYLFTYHD